MDIVFVCENNHIELPAELDDASITQIYHVQPLSGVFDFATIACNDNIPSGRTPINFASTTLVIISFADVIALPGSAAYRDITATDINTWVTAAIGSTQTTFYNANYMRAKRHITLFGKYINNDIIRCIQGDIPLVDIGRALSSIDQELDPFGYAFTNELATTGGVVQSAVLAISWRRDQLIQKIDSQLDEASINALLAAAGLL